MVMIPFTHSFRGFPRTIGVSTTRRQHAQEEQEYDALDAQLHTTGVLY